MHHLGLRLASASVRASSSAPRFKSRWDTRKLHQRQSLPYSVEEGLGKFLPPEALNVQLEWQDGLLERLNEQVVDTAESSASVAQTVINLSGKRDKILAFNYASLALNNSFFLNNLKPPSNNTPTYEHEISEQLMINIRNNHGSIQQLRSAFSAAALGTFVNGWIWFVSDQAGNTGMITTYGAGTLLIRSRANMQRHPNLIDGSQMLPPPSRSPLTSTPPPAPLHSRFSHDDASDFLTAPAGLHSSIVGTTKRVKTVNMLHAGEILYPLFCVPVYEHAWMSAGYGVWGKERWLREFWSVLNWQRVDAAYNAIWQDAQKKNQ